MAKETRKPIESGADIIEWAKQTRERKGELFTALSKGEQLVIAEFILGMDEYLRNGNGGLPPQPKTAGEEPIENNIPKKDAQEDDPAVAPANKDDSVLTNAEYFRASNTGVKVAFNMFKRRIEVDPDRYGIFENGRILMGASFAYWLNMPKT